MSYSLNYIIGINTSGISDLEPVLSIQYSTLNWPVNVIYNFIYNYHSSFSFTDIHCFSFSCFIQYNFVCAGLTPNMFHSVFLWIIHGFVHTPCTLAVLQLYLFTVLPVFCCIQEAAFVVQTNGKLLVLRDICPWSYHLNDYTRWYFLHNVLDNVLWH